MKVPDIDHGVGFFPSGKTASINIYVNGLLHSRQACRNATVVLNIDLLNVYLTYLPPSTIESGKLTSSKFDRIMILITKAVYTHTHVRTSAHTLNRLN